ncbi:MAG TPA: cytochrome c peroxidase [Sediminibacterium sp.]|nr:cytochrome c peroxidase [Sediminibacterium sp.]
MKKILVIVFIITGVGICSFNAGKISTRDAWYSDTLRALYLQPTGKWPAPFIDSGVSWKELGILPGSPLNQHADSVKQLVHLGKMLFFDPRLSGSGQISCASCHVPDMSWTDGRERAVGHDQQLGKRNTPSLSNIWASPKLFWDGRANTLEDQAYGPVNNDIEMHGSMPQVPASLRKIAEYKKLFINAYGTEEINVERIVHALATYERTLVSRKSDFDYFLQGEAARLNDAALRGLHLFRTKARCMNCHNGPLFTDQQFHNVGLTYYGREFEDLGLYRVTGKAAHVGQFKTPSLRDVMRTRPWMHNGLFDDMDGVLNMYNAGMPQPKPKPEQVKDSLFPQTDPLLRKLNLTKEERQDIIAFLNAITAQPWKVRIPVLPK